LWLPKVVGDLAMAERLQGLLNAGEAKNRAALARRFRLTRARITQLLNMLKLHPLIRAYVKSLPPGTPTNMITERGLRTLSRLGRKKQVVMAATLVPGFSTFVPTMT